MPPFLEITSKDFFTRLCSLPFVEAIYVYGSRARGEADDWSDIDLAIDCPTASPQDWLKVVEIAENAQILVPVQVVRLDEIQNEGFKTQVERYKQLLYKRNG